MTREELLALVNGVVDTTKFKSLSQKTINEELDDVLEDFGDDEAANNKIVTKLANRLKRMDGNVHKSVSDEMKKNREAEEERERQRGKDRTEREQEHEDENPRIKALEDKINKILEANTERDKKAAKDATIKSIKEGLTEKFKEANLKVNPFFLKTALGRIEIPEGEADVKSLVDKAEVLYNEDAKEAGWVPETSKPNAGGGGGGNGEIGEHEFDDIKAMVARTRPKKTE